jgi:hypothetical protein
MGREGRREWERREREQRNEHAAMMMKRGDMSTKGKGRQEREREREREV